MHKKRGRGKLPNLEKFLKGMGALVIPDLFEKTELTVIFALGCKTGTDEKGDYIFKRKKLYPEKFGYTIIKKTDTEIVLKKLSSL